MAGPVHGLLVSQVCSVGGAWRRICPSPGRLEVDRMREREGCLARLWLIVDVVLWQLR